MQTPDLLEEIAQTRAKPLQIECQRPDGSRTVCSVEECSVEECSAHGWRYVHIVADELDELLDRALNGTRTRRRR